MHNIWWAAIEISVFFKILNYKYSFSWLYLPKTIDKYTQKRNKLKTFVTFPRAIATPCHHASNIKADKRTEWKYPEQNFSIPNHR